MPTIPDLLDVLVIGMAIRDMIGSDIPMRVEGLQYFGETLDKCEGAVPNTAGDALHHILGRPVEVVDCILSWNYPLMMTAWKVAPALAAGNSVVLKPAEQSPLSTGLMARLLVKTGVIRGNGFAHGDIPRQCDACKHSGNGRDNCLENIVAHTQSKSVWVHLGSE